MRLVNHSGTAVGRRARRPCVPLVKRIFPVWLLYVMVVL
jgi:hypothetical protein